MTDQDWRGLFYKLARHLPGLGGLASFDAMTIQDVLELCRLVREGLEREADSWRRALGGR